LEIKYQKLKSKMTNKNAKTENNSPQIDADFYDVISPRQARLIGHRCTRITQPPIPNFILLKNN